MADEHSQHIVTLNVIPTDVVVTVNSAEVAPAGTVTIGGGIATFELLLVRPTTAPPAGAEPVSVTVP